LGGQKQLLASARVANGGPGILVLDEATANLDVGTEVMIQEALERLLVNRSAIIIAHRLSTIRNVDRILVLKQGQLVESGSHAALLAQDGLYRRSSLQGGSRRTIPETLSQKGLQRFCLGFSGELRTHQWRSLTH